MVVFGRKKGLLYGRRLGEMNDDRIVKKVVRCLVQARDVGWWQKYWVNLA